ncbi:hypothetical protein A8F94_08130 [Bacillus sp. FJAT-27225]|uniref:hypothetical protein n=1 Tax=Bacillus sp. FJAT-27225 TaxID=1743144 RepID=UPI00080C2778|nr:hypothetical protein [Bacillus sp. FJAT-27225]OCA87801.1 hypothetical protein A8F94_08130 [Bacillus sp. FJAT-27225]
MTRVKIKPYQAKYDKSHDVLHVFFFLDFLTVDEEEFPGVLIRKSIRDEETIAGLTILDYNERTADALNNILPQYDFTEIQLH